mgnify:FL=1
MYDRLTTSEDPAMDAIRATGEGIKGMTQNAVDNVGEAISGGLDAINPFS